MNAPAPLAPARPALLAALVHALLFAAAVVFFRHPDPAPSRTLLTALWLVPPALLALWASARKARAAQGSERVFWTFLAATCSLHALGVLLLLWRGLDPAESALATVLGLVAYHGSFALLIVGLLVPPDRPAAPLELRKAALEWLLVGVGVAFLVAYFVLLPRHRSPWPFFVLHTAEEGLPALLMLRRARLVGEPHRSAFSLLAFGFGTGALLGLRGNWLYVSGRYEHYGLLDLAWMLPYWSVLAAARVRTDAPWLVQTPVAPGEGQRARFAALAVAGPPLVDLVVRALGVPGDEEARSLLALVASALLALLVGLRLRQAAALRPRPLPAPHADDGSPELGRLASGTAHELNNPLMAVVVAAELALARGGAEAPLLALQEAVHQSAAAVRRFQLVESDRDPGAPGNR